MRKIVLLLFVLAMMTALAERQPYERYQTIVDRQMFGQPPVGFDPSKMPSEVAKSSSREEKELSQEQEKVKKAIRFSVINVTPTGETMVGFSDNGDPKNPLHYYLKVGESQNGWVVKEADPETATMTIEKDGIEVALQLGADSASSSEAVSRAGSSVAPTATPYSAGASAGRSNLLGGNLRERRLQREAAEAAKRADEEKARAEREKQRDEVQNELLNQLNSMREEQRKQREEEEARKAAAEAEPVCEA